MSEDITGNPQPSQAEGALEAAPQDASPEVEKVEVSKEEYEKLLKNGELAQNYKIRAEKAEGKLKDVLPQSVPTQDSLSPKDALLLAKAEVSLEDVDEVVEYAKYRKIAIGDALKDPTLKAILSTRVEERKTAAATHTRGGARGASKVTGEDLLRKAEATGEVPEDPQKIREIVEARMARRKNK